MRGVWTVGLVIGLAIGCQSASRQQDDALIPLKGTQIDTTAPMPRIALSDSVVHLGQLPPDTVIRYPLIVQNIGQRPLIIQRAFSACGCVVTDLPRAPILPGQKDTLWVSLDTRRLPEGARTRTVTIVSNTIPNTHYVRLLFELKPSARGTTQTISPMGL